MSRRRLAGVALLLAASAGRLAEAQSWDTSGNGLLKGTYYFRTIAWQGQNDSINDLQAAIAIYGTITFDGAGTYTFNASEYDGGSTTGVPLPYTPTKGATYAYSLGANGYGFLSSLIISGDSVNFLVSNGVLVGSTTDNASAYNDLFIAAPLTNQTISTFQGNYSMVGLASSTGNVAETRAYSFPLNADGNGGIGIVRLTGYVALNGSTVTNQTATGVKYIFSSGAAKVTFGSELTTANMDTALMSGTKYLYFSPDGNLVFGGSPIDWDFIVGVRLASSPGDFSGLYYTAGMYQDDSPAAASAYVNLNNVYGSVNVLSGGIALGHRRTLTVSPSSAGPYDYTYSDTVKAGTASGTYSDSFSQYTFGAGGSFGVGFAAGSSLGIEVLVQAPPATAPSGVYIYPTGIVNAGNLAPFTASWAPGELVSIYGSNLASSTKTDGTLPTQLAGVQVLVNGTPAPIYFVSAGQINAVIPLSVTSLSASIQVMNNGILSNTVYNYVGLTQPGIFNSISSLPAFQHAADYSMVTSSSPARIGETILVYLTGVGDVDATGKATNAFTVAIGGVPATIVYAGTQSTVGGGYQMNVTVPSGVTAGNPYIDIAGPDSYNSSAVIAIGAGSAAVSQPSAMALRQPAGRRNLPGSGRRRQATR